MRAYKGIRVIDFTQALSGPMATQLLALLDADVVKIEPPGSGDQLRGVLTDRDTAARRQSPAFLTANLNKRSLALDLKNPAGRNAVQKLLAGADVVVENFVPGVARRLGIDYETVRASNPDVIYCSVSGYGQTGPRCGERAYDSAIQADAGMMSLTGHPETGPTRTGFMLVDVATGISAAYAISSALFRRERTGKGQYLDVAMFDSALQLMCCQAAEYLVNGALPPLAGNDSPMAQPTSGTFATADGMILTATLTSAQQEATFEAIGRSDLLDDPRFSSEANREANLEAGRAIVRSALAARSTAHWLTQLKARGVPVQAVRDLDEALGDPQLAARGLLVNAGLPPDRSGNTPPLIGAPFITPEDGPLAHAVPPVEVGADSEAILREIGLSDPEIDQLLSHAQS